MAASSLPVWYRYERRLKDKVYLTATDDVADFVKAVGQNEKLTDVGRGSILCMDSSSVPIENRQLNMTDLVKNGHGTYDNAILLKNIEGNGGLAEEVEKLKLGLRHQTTNVENLRLEVAILRHQTISLSERGKELLTNQLRLQNVPFNLCNEELPSNAYDTSLFLIDDGERRRMREEDYSVNAPTHRVMEKLLPSPCVSHLTCQRSTLVHNVREHRVDIVVSCSPILAWQTVLIFMEGKLNLIGDDLKVAVGQCSQRTYAFMEETKHDHLIMEKPRDVVWACFFDRTDIGFYCRRRNLLTEFPFPYSEDSESLEVIFEKEPFLNGGNLGTGGEFLWRLLRTPIVLDYFEKQSLPEVILKSSSGKKSWRALHIKARGNCGGTTLSSIIVAADISRNSTVDTFKPTHAIKLFPSKGKKNAEYLAYAKLQGVPNVARLVDDSVQGHYNGTDYVGIAIEPYGSALTQGMESEQIISLARQIGSALCIVHKQKVIHRDITPNNIIFYNNEYFLIDFNVAYRSYGQGFEPQHSFIGTRRWASLRRQRLKSGKYPTPSFLDDWESFFLTLYELICGHDKDIWSTLQGFNSSVVLKLPKTAPNFLAFWYDHLVEQQDKKKTDIDITFGNTLMSLIA